MDVITRIRERTDEGIMVNMLEVATSVQKDWSGVMTAPLLLGPGIFQVWVACVVYEMYCLTKNVSGCWR